MSPSDGNKSDQLWLELDERLYHLDSAESDFLMAHTGINNPEELKRHVLGIQAEAYQVHHYPCIRIFEFAKLKISRLPAYKDLLDLREQRPDALFLDVGCGTGVDIRKAISDGFPAEQVIATDLHPTFWNLGHKLFNSTSESLPVKFIAGDIFDSEILSDRGENETEDLDSLGTAAIVSLNPLRRRVSVIFVYAVFHLFDEGRQRELAQKLGSLLSLIPGSIIFGEHTGEPEKRIRTEVIVPGGTPQDLFCHSPESWIALWKEVLGEGRVEVTAALREFPKEKLGFPTVNGDTYWYMNWSVRIV